MWHPAAAEPHASQLLLHLLLIPYGLDVAVGVCAGGEMPAATAAVIYFIRASVIRDLPEPGQRKLLAALARATSHAIAPPVIVAALEGCGVLLEILGVLLDNLACFDV